jgi:hypothetical protein
MDDSLTSAIDNWRKKSDDEPSRPEAIRRLVELGLKVKGKWKIRDGQQAENSNLGHCRLDLPDLILHAGAEGGGQVKRNKKWSREDDRLLLELKDAGTPLAVIAEKLERTQAAIDGRMNALKNHVDPELKVTDQWTRVGCGWRSWIRRIHEVLRDRAEGEG